MAMRRWNIAVVLILSAVAVTALWHGASESPSKQVAAAPGGSGVLFRVVNEDDEPVPGAQVGGRTTDANGYCRVAAERDMPVTIRHSRYAAARLAVSDTSAEQLVRLGRGQTLKAKVVLEGTNTPLADAKVELSLWGGPLNVLSPRVETTNARGIATWINVPSCTVSMVVLPPKYQSLVKSFEIVEGLTPSTMILEVRESTHLLVELVDSEGEPVLDARVLRPNPWSSWPLIDKVDNGVYEADLVRYADLYIDIIDTTWRHGSLVFKSDGRPDRVERVVLKRTEPARSLMARFVDDATGQPIPGVRATLRFRVPIVGGSEINSDAMDMHELVSDADGKLAVEGIGLAHVNFDLTSRGTRLAMQV